MPWFDSKYATPSEPEVPERIHVTALTATKEGISTLDAQGYDLSYAVTGEHDLYVYETPRDADTPSLIGVLRGKRWDTVLATDWEIR